MEIYADIVFAVNMGMDTLILWTAGKILHKKTSGWRLLMGGAVMAMMYCIAILAFRFHPAYHFLLSVLMLVTGIFIAFFPKNIKDYAKLLAVSYVSSFILGGLGLTLYYNTGFMNILNADFGGVFSVKLLLFSVVGFYILIKLILIFFNRLSVKRQVFLPVRIYINEVNAELQALVDTGHSLTDPLSKAPVVIAELESIKGFLPDDLRDAFMRNAQSDPGTLAEIHDSAFMGRIRMIPFESIGKQHGILVGFRSDKVEIYTQQEILSRDNVVIGIYNFKLSKDGCYQGLISPGLINPET